MPIQWHPLFARLLRPLLEDYYEVQTNVPVGDVPREADLVLLRRTAAKTLPFLGLWRHLTTWNILEYKGPTVSARLEDVSLLVELGLGIHRRLNEERLKAKQKPVSAAEVAFWYMANSLGRRFQKNAARMFGTLEIRGDGVWHARLLERHVFLVSTVDVPVEPDAVPLHLLSQEPMEKELALVRLVAQKPSLWLQYREILGSLHPQTAKELEAMAKTARGPKFHLKPLMQIMGHHQFFDELDELTTDEEKKKLIRSWFGKLFPAKRAELKRLLESEDSR